MEQDGTLPRGGTVPRGALSSSIIRHVYIATDLTSQPQLVVWLKPAPVRRLRRPAMQRGAHL